MDKARFCRATLLERVDFTDDLAVFRFKPDRELTFIPGQYATLAVEIGDTLIQRAYSIVSSPREPTLEFFIELVPHGQLTPHLWRLKADESLFIRSKIVGRFTLDTPGGFDNQLMLATVTGIAPYLSMARTQQFDADRGAVHPYQFAIIHGASHSRELGLYKDELDSLSRSGWLRYVPTVSRPWEDPDWSGETGRVEDLIRKYADRLGFDFTNSVAYACGHPQMIENAKSILLRARYLKEQLRDEKYFTT